VEEILNKLYSYEYFGFYLVLSIIILIIIFLIVLFCFKKDKKEREIEATKKLQQINTDAFQEEATEVKLEVNNEDLENTIVVPSIEEVPTINNVEVTNEIPEPVIPVVQEVKEETVSIEPQIEQIPEVVNEEVSNIINEPLPEKIEEKPLVFEDLEVKEEFVAPIIYEEVKQEVVVPDITLEEENIPEVPEFNFEDLVKEVEEVKKNDYSKGPQIFSSVYVPEPKEEIKEEQKVVTNSFDEDMEFELPTLKETPKEEKIEVPVLNDYNLDELAGETYNINKK